MSLAERKRVAMVTVQARMTKFDDELFMDVGRVCHAEQRDKIKICSNVSKDINYTIQAI